ncbi:tryptophan-rich sensory protein [Streptobacillus felis]|uniref:Tryptophan-rich sensory protein n=1 Tax=Streptobacillus felis TaxID=1384509 RepID=A0A7Z0PF82_9FUSO|nr:tryptophan-rich sensory protein [Streptobacillus felis]NYV27944.1 tryptophan-rich sensory protein [Streptobacillus felis]
MRKQTICKINILMFVITIIVNYLIATSKFPGLMSQKVVSNMYDTAITPIGFTFSIWGIIYLSLFISLLLMYKNNSMDRKVAILNIFMLITNICWNILFGLSFIGLSVIAILIYWIILFGILRRYGIEKNIYSISYGLHFGWITIASVVNIYAYLVSINFSHLRDNRDLWTICAIVIVSIASLLLSRYFKNGAISLAIAWAIFGIHNRYDVYVNYPFIEEIIKGSFAMLFAGAFVALISKQRKK